MTDDPSKDKQDYNQSMKYIEDFYKKNSLNIDSSERQ